MPRPGDLTPEQAAAEAQRLRERWREADRIAAPLYAETYALLNATEEELRDVLPHEDVDQILEYRSQPALVVDEQIRRLPLRPQPQSPEYSRFDTFVSRRATQHPLFDLGAIARQAPHAACWR
jgi:hypothetical protein